MKILNIRIKGYRQFKDTFIDFTDPATGKAADKVCFIGANGTGKSTLLELIYEAVKYLPYGQQVPTNFNCFMAVKFVHQDAKFYKVFRPERQLDGKVYATSQIYLESIGQSAGWFEHLYSSDFHAFREYGNSYYAQHVDEVSKILNASIFKSNSTDLVVSSPSEGISNSYLGFERHPQTNVDEALKLNKNFPANHIVSNETVRQFWTNLIYSIKKRDEEREEFERNERNINKTKKELIEEFDKLNPKILDKLAELWNGILEKSGLMFDAAGANNPIQLTDNLNANIYTKETRELIEYNQLSTGIRNFIFRIGHIFSLYFNREIKRGIVLVDEIENSLFPDFLYDIINVYEQTFYDINNENNTQFFVATHSPIVAAQFKPYERIILEWDEPGSVKAHKGKAPEGDDPNDVLSKDFGIRHLMGQKGEEMWREYLDLRKKLRHTTDEIEKDLLVNRITEIGTTYNF